MKALVYVRHSIKGAGANSAIILREGIEAARKAVRYNLPSYAYSHVFYGPEYRTVQTLLVYLASGGWRAEIHEPVEEIGTNELFQGWAKMGAKLGAGKTNIDALREAFHPVTFRHFCDKALEGVTKMFDQMADDETGLAVGHSPVIEMAAEASGASMDGKQLPENGFAYFIQDDTGAITAAEC